MIGTLLAERYLISQRLGHGGFGSVYRARDERLHRDVAVKVLHDGAQGAHDDLLQEARACTAIDHPNVVLLLDVEDGDPPFLVFEHVNGMTLAEMLRARGHLTERDAAAVATQILAGLEAAHGVGIVHRDVKPANILITAALRLKIADFGIALRASDAPTRNQPPGTAYYLAPELTTLGTRATPQTDIYAVGVTLFQLLTGELPFDGETAWHVAEQVQTHDVPSIRNLRPEVSIEMQAIVEWALDKDPDARIQTCAKFLAKLGELAVSERIGQDGDSSITFALEHAARH